MDFNPIIVLFLTFLLIFLGVCIYTFQSYYSLIFNCFEDAIIKCSILNFNPIIVLFLTRYGRLFFICSQYYFNPIIVLFLTAIVG